VVLGSGFVGRAVADALSQRASISIMDLPTHPPLASRGSAGRALLLDELERTGARAIVNACGRLRGTDEELAEANFEWPKWLTEVLEDRGVRLVHIGSASEYGDPGSSDPVPESATPRPSGTYGETKLAGTRAVLDARGGGLDAVVARGFNLVAPELPDVSPLHQFVDAVTALPCDGGEVTLWWPSTVRDFILLNDLAEAVARLALAPVVPDLVNVCSGVGISFENIVRAVAAAQGKAVAVRSLDRPGIEAVVGDGTRLFQCTGLAPTMSVEIVARNLAAA
jgi:nucleoside-diphosphate-sugar epimerase